MDRNEIARQMGADAGKSAASWVFDGGTSQENYRTFLTMWDDGDPEMGDVYGPTTGWLSGEWADAMTPRALADDLGIEQDDMWAIEEACDAYEDAAESAYWSELERVARLQVSE